MDPRILLNKLSKFGIRGNALKLIESYLTNRRELTCIKKINLNTKTEITYLSKPRNISYGVPQGSILGPLLFLCYINDLPRAISHPMTLFADDCTVVFAGNDFNTHESNINDNLNIIIQWLKVNNLRINLDKTHIMTFKQRIISPDLDIKYENNTITDIDNTKFLGIWLDQNLSWKVHISNLIKKN